MVPQDAINSVSALQINRQQTGKHFQGQQHGKKCRYCETGPHLRARCPAKRNKHHKCGKACHWASVCRSSSIAAQGDVDFGHSISSVLCCLSDISFKKRTVHEDVISNGVDAVNTLIDPGTTDCFLFLLLAQQFGLKVT